ncbi:MAG: glycosyltransferase family 2 protein, partial [Hyphomicrobiales bacterium]
MAASISVIIPAYNASRTLAETLDSVARQTRTPFEVVVVDDGSSDDTVEVARRFTDILPRLQVISVPNGGVSRARNIAIAASSGDIIAPLDADDLWHPTYLERTCTTLERLGPGAGFAYCFWRGVDFEGRVASLNEVVIVEGIGFYRLLAHNYVGNGSNYVMWRHRLEAIGTFDERLLGNEDFNVQVRLAWTGPVGAVPERLVGYRNSPNSLSKQWRLMAEHGIAMLARLREELPAEPKAMDWALSSAHLHFHFVVVLFGAGTWLEGTRHLLIGTLYDPMRTVFRVGASVKSRLYRRIAILRGRWQPPGTPELVGRHFYEVHPAANWPYALT